MWVTAPPRIDPVMPSTIRLFQAIRMRLKVAGKGLNRCQSLAQSVLRQPHGGVDLQLVHDALAMRLYRLHADVEQTRNLLHAFTIRQQSQDLLLPAGERLEW